MSVSSLLASASQAHGRGNLAESAEFCRQALIADPNNLQAHLLSGVVAMKLGDPMRAIPFLQKVRGADPQSYQARFWLSLAYRKIQRISLALETALEAVSLNGNDPQGQAQLGTCYLDLRLLPEAEQCLRIASTLAPQVLPIHCSLAQCLTLQGRKREAVSAIRAVLIRLNPNLETLVKFGQVLLIDSNALCAVEFGRRAIELDPTSPSAYLLLGRALIDQNLGPEAEPILRRAVELDHADPEAVAVLASSLQSLGYIEEANQLFARSIGLQPNQAYAYYGILHNRKVTESDRAYLSAMRQILEDGRLPEAQAKYLNYALGKAYEDLCEFEASMKQYDLANAIEYRHKFGDGVFDRDGYAERFHRLQNTFTAPFLSQNSSVGSMSQLPIFVVGMMRSGTTLVEQILSCHPDVGAAGEQTFWPDNWRQTMSPEGDQMNASGLLKTAMTYLELMQELAPGKAHVVDKLPGNYAGLGIIHLAFPHSKIIHTRRNPVDTCLSIYATPNRARAEFSNNRDNIVFAYEKYVELMKHWRAVLPPENFMDVDYEDLVSNSASETRRIIEFCGLPWDERCLRPQDNRRSVVTPSVWQVRQPIYRSSMARWRRFEPWLGAFSKLVPVEQAV